MKRSTMVSSFFSFSSFCQRSCWAPILITVLFITGSMAASSSRPQLLDAYKSPLKALTSPNNYYFLEFPLNAGGDKDSQPICGDGSPYSFMFRRGSNKHLNKLIIEFEGGPSCWNDETCCSASANKVQTPWEDYLETSEQKVIDGNYFPPLGSCIGITEGLIEYGAPALLGTETEDIPICLRKDGDNADDYNYYTSMNFNKDYGGGTTNTTDDDDDLSSSSWWEQLGGIHSDISEWSYVFVPHCTLDWHMGYQNQPQTYSCGDDESDADDEDNDNKRQIYHRGGINVDSVLNFITTEFQLPLEAMVTVSGGKVGGCGDVQDVSSIVAPLKFASQIDDETTKVAQGPIKDSMLVITEGGSLWKNRNNLKSHAPAMAKQWNSHHLSSQGDYMKTNQWLDLVEDTIAQLPDSINIAWIGSDGRPATDNGDQSNIFRRSNINAQPKETSDVSTTTTSSSSKTEELTWLNELSICAKGGCFQVYMPSDIDDELDDNESCPIFALPEFKIDSIENKAGLANFIEDVVQDMSWSKIRQPSSSSSSSSSSESEFSSSEGVSLRSSVNEEDYDDTVDDNDDESGRSRLAFLSVCMIVLGIYFLAWMWYFGVKHYRMKRNIPTISLRTPHDIWFIALTEYSLLFFLVSLLIPMILSFLAFMKTSGGESVEINLDFDSYLDINTYEENVFQSYHQAQIYQRESVLIEDSNCALLSGGTTNFDDRRLHTDDDESSFFSIMMNDVEPSSQTSSSSEKMISLAPVGGQQQQQQQQQQQHPQQQRDLIQGYGQWYGAGQGIVLIYTNRNGGNVFTPEAIEQMRQFEESIMEFPGFEDYCYMGRSGQCDALDSIVPSFFGPDGNMVDIPSVLQPLTQSVNAIWRMDQYFSPQNLGSNMTKTFLWFRNVGGDQREANEFLKSLYREFFWKTDLKRPYVYPDLVYTWEHPYLNNVESQDALNHDAAWSIASFVFIGLMIFLKVRNVFTFVFGMLGLALSFSTAYYWVSFHFDIPQLTLLHVSALFVMLGIGADDIFLMIDSFDHTKIEFSNDGDDSDGVDDQQDLDSPDIIRQRMKSAYSKAGSMMLVSSMTTAVCFFSNAFGVVVVIQEFGIYMGMVVLVNYMHVMTILPSAMMVNELYVKPYMRCCGKSKSSSPPLPDAENKLEAQSERQDERKDDGNHPDTEVGLNRQSDDEDAASISSKQLSVASSAKKQVNAADTQQPSHNQNTSFLQNTSKMNRTDRWLVEKYAPFVSNRRWSILLSTVALALALAVVSIFTFAMNNGTIVIFTEQYNLGRLTIINEEYFNGDVQKTTETVYLDPTAGPTGPNGGYGGDDGSGGEGSGGSGGGGSGYGGGGGGTGGGGGGGGGVGGGGGGDYGDEGDGATPPPTPNPFEDSGLCPIPCQNGGICNFEGTCTCPRGWGGGFCIQKVAIEYVDCMQPCLNGGFCNSWAKCTCRRGYSGDYCQVQVCPILDGEECAGQGTCVPHPDGYEGATVCECVEGYGGADCTVPLVAAVKRSDSITVKLVWGVEPEPEPSKLWMIHNDQGLDEDSAMMLKGLRSSFDVSEPVVQEWLYETVQRARNDTTLHVREGFPTWIEIVHDYAISIEDVGFPIPKHLFVGYVQLLRAQDRDFAALISDEIGTTSPGLAGDFLYASVTFRVEVLPSETKISEMKLEQWTAFTDTINHLKPEFIAPVLAQSQVFLTAHRTEATVNSTLSTWVISNLLCLGIILIFTQNTMLSFMVMVTILLIFMCLGGLLFGVFAIPFGPIEALGVSIFIGLSANYSLHVVHAYHRSASHKRSEKVKEAVFVVGSPITASALSTIGGCIFLFACRTWAFKELGILICCVTAMALLYSMTFLLSWLASIGPLPYDIPGDEKNDGHHLHQYDMMACCHRGLTIKTSEDNSSSEDPTAGLPAKKTTKKLNSRLSSTNMLESNLSSYLSDDEIEDPESPLQGDGTTEQQDTYAELKDSSTPTTAAAAAASSPSNLSDEDKTPSQHEDSMEKLKGSSSLSSSAHSQSSSKKSKSKPRKKSARDRMRAIEQAVKDGSVSDISVGSLCSKE